MYDFSNKEKVPFHSLLIFLMSIGLLLFLFLFTLREGNKTLLVAIQMVSNFL